MNILDNAIFAKLKKFIMKPYYYVPPCPICKSAMTGTFVTAHRATDTNWMINEALRNGEIVKPVEKMPSEANAFCLDCGYTWYAPIHMKMVPISEIENEIVRRHTQEILQIRYAEQAEEEKGRSWNVVSRYIGKI